MQLPDLCLSLRCVLLRHSAHPLCLPRWLAVCLPHDEPWAKPRSPGPHFLGKRSHSPHAQEETYKLSPRLQGKLEVLTSNFGLLELFGGDTNPTVRCFSFYYLLEEKRPHANCKIPFWKSFQSHVLLLPFVLGRHQSRCYIHWFQK